MFSQFPTSVWSNWDLHPSQYSGNAFLKWVSSVAAEIPGQRGHLEMMRLPSIVNATMRQSQSPWKGQYRVLGKLYHQLQGRSQHPEQWDDHQKLPSVWSRVTLHFTLIFTWSLGNQERKGYGLKWWICASSQQGVDRVFWIDFIFDYFAFCLLIFLVLFFISSLGIPDNVFWLYPAPSLNFSLNYSFSYSSNSLSFSGTYQDQIAISKYS